MTNYYIKALAGVLVMGSLTIASAKVADLPLKKGRSIEVPAHPALAKTAVSGKSAKKTSARGKVVRREVSMAENEVWRPVTQTLYGWDEDAGDWYGIEEITTTWSAAGKHLVDISKSLEEEDEYSKTEMVYDDYGYLTSQLSYVGTSADDMEPSSRKIREYDPRMHGLIVSNTEERWNPVTSSWVPSGNIYRRVVTRDGNGNVTCVQMELFYDGRYDPMEKYDFYYGSDNKVNKIVYSQMKFDYTTFLPVEWVEDVVYDEIEWYAFDGQIYDLDCIFEGNNKVKTFTQVLDGEPVSVSTVAYVGDTDDFVLVGEMDGAVYEQTWLNYENGGYVNHVVRTEELGEGEKVVTEEYVNCALFNELGSELLVAEYEIDGDELLFGCYSVGDEVRDPENGFLQSYVMREFWPMEEDYDEDYYALASRSLANDLVAPLDQLEGEWYNFVKIEFSDYRPAGTGAVDKIASDIADGKAEYFTIDGRRVNGAPAPGLYIRRTAAGTSKVFVK